MKILQVLGCLTTDTAGHQVHKVAPRLVMSGHGQVLGCLTTDTTGHQVHKGAPRLVMSGHAPFVYNLHNQCYNSVGEMASNDEVLSPTTS